MKVGMDIGTSTSSICVDIDGDKHLIKCGTGSGSTASFIPSAVYLKEDGTMLIGQVAEQNKMRDPQCFAKSFKRDLGQDIPLRLGNKDFKPEQLIEKLIIHLKECAEGSELTPGDKITEATICHPANFSQYKKDLLLKAAKNAGIEKVVLLDEPTAAAYYYNSKDKVDVGEKLLIYDLGGGTFDVTIMEKTDNGLRLLTRPLGIDECGGDDFNYAIYQHIHNDETIGIEQIKAMFNSDDMLKMFESNLEESCVKAKELLSHDDKASIYLTFKSGEITREEFERLIKEYVDETIDKVMESLKNARLKTADIDKILLVGGSCRIPYIKKRLVDEVGDIVVADVDPDLAVVYGSTSNFIVEDLNENLNENPEKDEKVESKENQSEKATESNAKEIIIDSQTNSQKVNNAIILVDQSGVGNSTTIQGAIDMALDNSKIIVHSGTYDENLVINKPLHIAGYSENGEVSIVGECTLESQEEIIIDKLSIKGSVMIRAKATINNCSIHYNGDIITVSSGSEVNMNKVNLFGQTALICQEWSKTCIKDSFINTLSKAIHLEGELLLINTNVNKHSMEENLGKIFCGIEMVDGKLELRKSEVNSYPSTGIILGGNKSVLTLNESRIRHNENGLVCVNEAELKIKDSEFNGNNKSGIFMSGSSECHIVSTTFASNNCGIELSKQVGCQIDNCKFISNKPYGVYITEDVYFHGNQLEFRRNKYGVYTKEISKLAKLFSSSFTSDTVAVENQGGVIECSKCIINKSSEHGAYAEAGTIRIKDSTLTDNKMGISGSDKGKIEITQSNIKAGIWSKYIGNSKVCKVDRCRFDDVLMPYIPYNERVVLLGDYKERIRNKYNVMKGQLGKNVIYGGENIPVDTFNKAKKKYLKVDNRSDIILYIEKSILGKGNLGLALTRNKIYWRNNILNSGIEIKMSTIEYVNLIGDELMIKTSDGDIAFPFDDIVLKCFLLKVIYDI